MRERRFRMANIELLKDEIKRAGKSNAQIAQAIGMDESTFYRKLGKKGATFTVAQACKIADTLEISADTAQNIFFAR